MTRLFASEILELAHNAFVALDPTRHVTYWNTRAEELFGVSRERALGEDLVELIAPPRDRDRHRAALTFTDPPEAPNIRRRLQLEGQRDDGSTFPIEVTIAALQTDHERVFVAWIQDVSERRELLRELEAQLRRGSPGFAEILDSLAEAVTIRDPHHHILYANRAALEHLGFDSLEELQGKPLHSIFDDYLVHDEAGRELTMNDIPSVRLLGGEPPQPLVLRTINRASGEVRWQLLKSSTLRDDTGRPVAAVTVIEDITRERTAELRDRFLARTTETLMISLDYQDTLRNVAWLVVPELADWCAVDLVDAHGARQQVVVAHRDPSKLALAQELRRFDPPEIDPERGLARVLRTGAAELYREVPDEWLVQAAVDAEHLRLLRTVGFRSVLIVPMRVRGRTLGAMTLVTAESLRRFGEADVQFAERIATRAAIAVDNARLASARRDIAATLQNSLLPRTAPSIDGWEIATMYRPAGTAEEVEVGGDFYDFFETPAGWLVLLGDVTGKGALAAGRTSLLRHGARFLAKHDERPSRILAGLDEALRDEPDLPLCTAVCLRLHAGRLVIASAGHPALLILRDDGHIREVRPTGPLLGAVPNRTWTDRTLTVRDETIFVYTDGVTDTLGEHERFGEHRLRRVLIEGAGKPPSQLLDALDAALGQFQAAEQADDTAAIALRPASSRQPT